ncbi:MAG: hypothetical protein FWD63_00520 [Propionibacteriaceae bacterium]|nr:hypothetical protein [Propionibacteriaceae bacterium]
MTWLKSKPMLVLLGIVVFGTILVWLRVRPEERGRLYAEDGVIFVGQWFKDPSPWLLFRPYAGYLQFVPRVAAGILALGPVRYWAVLATLAACVCVAVVSAVSYQCSRHLLTSWPTRLAVVLVPLLLPLAGIEPLGTLCNLHWWALYGAFWVLFAMPRARFAVVGLVAYTLALGLSEIQVAFFAPIALWFIVRSKNRGQRLISLALLVACAFQGVAYLATGRNAYSEDPQTFVGAVRGLVVIVFGGSVTSSVPLLAAAVAVIGVRGLALLAVVSVLPALLAFWRGSGVSRLAIAYGGIVGVALWFFAIYMVRYPGGLFTTMDTVSLGRWGVGAALCLLSAWIVALDQLVFAKRVDVKLAALTLVALFVVQSFSFTTTNPARLSGAGWSDFVSSARAQCGPGVQGVAAPVVPLGWQPSESDTTAWDVPCTRLG